MPSAYVIPALKGFHSTTAKWKMKRNESALARGKRNCCWGLNTHAHTVYWEKRLRGDWLGDWFVTSRENLIWLPWVTWWHHSLSVANAGPHQWFSPFNTIKHDRSAGYHFQREWHCCVPIGEETGRDVTILSSRCYNVRHISSLTTQILPTLYTATKNIDRILKKGKVRDGNRRAAMVMLYKRGTLFFNL